MRAPTAQRGLQVAETEVSEGMSQAEKSISDLLTPDEFDQFEAARANMTPYFSSGRGNRWSSKFSRDDFQKLVNQTSLWTPDRFEVIINTNKVPPQNYFTQFPLHNGTRFKLEPKNVQNLLGQGASIVLNGIEGMTEGLSFIRDCITGYSGGKVESNLYYSQPSHQAFSVHFDMHEVFAFQISGLKRWRIYQQAHRFPINHLAFMSGDQDKHEKAKGAVSKDLVMEPGDFLYLPAGYYHQAICVKGASIHLSFSIVEMIGLDVISEIFDAAVLEDFFRTPMARMRDGGNRPMSAYLENICENIAKLASDEKFAQRIEAKQRAFPYTTDKISLKR